MSEVNFKEWPVASTDEFEAIIIDVVKFTDSHYQAMFNLVKSFAEKDDSENQGMSIFSQMTGESLEELFEKIDVLIEIGFFGDAEVDALGTLYDSDFNEIEKIDWNGLDVEYAEDTVPPTYLH